jgi:hypothetical protein
MPQPAAARTRPSSRSRCRRTDTRLKASRVLTLSQCAAAYIKAHGASWKNVKHGDQWVNTLATYAGPIIGDIPVAAVDTDLVVKVLMPIWEAKTETATRLRGRIESVLDWVTVSKFRTGDNPARWRGHLENLLANPNKIAPVKNHPRFPAGNWCVRQGARAPGSYGLSGRKTDGNARCGHSVRSHTLHPVPIGVATLGSRRSSPFA